MRFLISHADSRKKKSLATRLRKKRMILLIKLLSNVAKKSITILDLGGTPEFWNDVQSVYPGMNRIIIVNEQKLHSTSATIHTIVCDARNLSCIRVDRIDCIFSNSVIEHLGKKEDQRLMADEIHRFGSKYFVQTPSFIFLIEPHFLTPFFHWLPINIRIWLHHRFDLGWFRKESNPERARENVESIRILKKSELRHLFPDARIITEYFWIFSKSYIATNL